MRIILKKYNFIILSVFLISGVLVTAWALSFHFDVQAKSAESQIELKNENQGTYVNDRILVLVCMGLVGFFGVRRQSKKLENFAKVKPSESSAREGLLNENNPEGLTFPVS